MRSLLFFRRSPHHEHKGINRSQIGSVRVKNKNIRPFANSTLLEIKINQLKRIKILDGIIINSNDDEMLKIAKNLNCETVKRNEYFASNSAPMSEVYKNMAENFNADIVAYTNVTNPLIKDSTIENMITEYFKNINKFDSVNSAHLVKEFMFKDNMPLNYDLHNQPRSQDLPNISALNFAVNIISRDTMIKNKNVVGFKPNIFLIDEIEGTDIDNPIDFEFAEYIYKKSESV